MENIKIRERKKRASRIVSALKKLFPKTGIVLKYSNHWELLVAVVLSAQCTDKKVNEVTEKLFLKYRTLDDYSKASRKEFEQDIRPTGFYRNKAKNILASAKLVKREYGGKIPRTMEEIMMLPFASVVASHHQLRSALPHGSTHAQPRPW